MDDTEWKRIQNVLCEERAVARDVAEERAYRPFDQGDAWVRELFPDMTPRQWGATFGRMVRRTSGIVIPKHPVPGTGPIAPQLRPDEAVENWEPDRHDHSTYGETARRRHEAGRKHDGAGVPVEGQHEHPHDPRYLLAPLPVRNFGFFHVHTERTTHGHFLKHHDVKGTHSHVDVAGDKYSHEHGPWEPCHVRVGHAEPGTHSHLKRAKDRRDSREKRLDVHHQAPWDKKRARGSTEFHAAVDLVFAIEGQGTDPRTITYVGGRVESVPDVQTFRWAHGQGEDLGKMQHRTAANIDGVLDALEAAPGGLTVGAIAEGVDASEASVKRWLGQLERRGKVRREPGSVEPGRGRTPDRWYRHGTAAETIATLFEFE